MSDECDKVARKISLYPERSWLARDIAYYLGRAEAKGYARGRREGMEEAAKIADEAAAQNRSDEAEDRAMMGRDYDYSSYGAGFNGGGAATADEIAAAIRRSAENA